MTDKYHVCQTSATRTSVIILIGFISSLNVMPIAELGKNTSDSKLKISQSSYVFDGIASTISPQKYPHMQKHDKDFTDAVSTFYATLSSRQVELGSEFEKVLSDNLSDLYGS